MVAVGFWDILIGIEALRVVRVGKRLWEGRSQWGRTVVLMGLTRKHVAGDLVRYRSIDAQHDLKSEILYVMCRVVFLSFRRIFEQKVS